MNADPFTVVLMARGLTSDLARRICERFSGWQELCDAKTTLLTEYFGPEERDAIRRAKARREIPRATVNRLINECEFRCCLCWNIDADSGVVIHHVRPHATNPDDSYENLVVLCVDHHSKVHTSWELARHPYPPELLVRRKDEFISAIAAFRAGKRAAPGREKDAESSMLVVPPLPPAHFIGRENLVRDIANALRLPNARVAIVGMGGVGKTVLALKVADGCREDFQGGVLWAEIASDSIGLADTLRGWIRSFGHDVTGMDFEEQLTLFGGLLEKRAATGGRLLLLLDDAAERIVYDLVRLTSYLSPSASILITTREATVCGALAATQFRVEPLERSQCRKLLEMVSSSALVPKEENAVDALLALLGDLPLAVELVARQIAIRECKPGFSLAGLCRRLQEFDPQILSFPGHRGIAMSFALSYDNLDENEKRVFRSFGILALGHPQTTNVAAIAAMDKEQTESVLDRFVFVSVLTWGQRVGDYRLHPLLHKYAGFLFERTDEAERSSVRIRYYQHYTSMASVVADISPENVQAIDEIFQELSKAIHYAASSGDHLAVCETVLGLSAEMSFFILRNRERESMPLLALAITAAKKLGDRDCEAACIGHLGTACARLGLVRDAMAHYEQAISIVRQTGNDYDLASHLQNLGSTLLSEATDLPRANRLLQEALAAAERSRNTDGVIGCLNTLGNLHRHIGDFRQAARLYSNAIEAARLAGDRLAEGNNLSNLGLVTEQLGDAIGGERMIREALAVAQEIGDKRGEGNRTGHIGRILLAKAAGLQPGSEQQDALEGAREHLTIALRIAQETGDIEKEGGWQMNLGSLYAFAGSSTEAIKYYGEALSIARSGGFIRLEAQAHYNLGIALALEGEVQNALNRLRDSKSLLLKMGSPTGRVQAHIDRLEAKA